MLLFVGIHWAIARKPKERRGRKNGQGAYGHSLGDGSGRGDGGTGPLARAAAEALTEAIRSGTSGGASVWSGPPTQDPDLVVHWERKPIEESERQSAFLDLLKEGRGLFDQYERHVHTLPGPMESSVAAHLNAFVNQRPEDWEIRMGDQFRSWANKCDQVVRHHCGNAVATLMSIAPLPTNQPTNVTPHLYGGWCEARRRMDWLRAELTNEGN